MGDAVVEKQAETINIAQDDNNSTPEPDPADTVEENTLDQAEEAPRESTSQEPDVSTEIALLSKENTTTNMTEAPSLTMYERSVRQKEERELKMKALQNQLESDYTFTPNRRSRPRTSSDDVSSLGDSPSIASGASVFSRLYSAETAASRSQQHIPKAKTTDRFGFAARTFTPKTKDSSPRVEALYKSGQEKLRARHLSDQEEADQLKKRLEDEVLKTPGVYTFRPKTQWDIVAERRKLAQEEKEREEDEAYRTMPKTINAVSILFSAV